MEAGRKTGSDPDPPLPWRSKTLRRSGPDLAQTWRQRRRKFFFCIRWGVNFRVYLMCGTLKMLGIYGESKYVCKT